MIGRHLWEPPRKSAYGWMVFCLRHNPFLCLKRSSWGLYPLNKPDYNPHTNVKKYGGFVDDCV